MSDQKTWAEMSYSEQETELGKIEREERYELLQAKKKALRTMNEASNIHIAVGAAQAYALMNGTLTSTSAPNRS